MSARNASLNPQVRLQPEVCSVAVVYEDVETRDFAIELCESLAQKFQGDLGFDFTWWGFRYLSDPEVGREATQAATNSDLIIICVHHAGSFPSEVKEWFQQWSSERMRSEGALVVVEADGGAGPAASRLELRLLAERANLDFLALPPGEGPGAEPQDGRGEGSKAGPRGEERYHSSGWGIDE